MSDGSVLGEPIVADPFGSATPRERAHADHLRAVAGAERPLAEMGRDLLKTVALLNGLAAASAIVFVAATLRDERRMAFAFVFPLACFGFGLTVAAFATGWSYLAQRESSRALASRALVPTPPFVAETTASREADGRGRRFQALAFAAVLVAMVSAVLGFGLAAAILVRTLG